MSYGTTSGIEAVPEQTDAGMVASAEPEPRSRMGQHVSVAVRRWRHMRNTAIVLVILATVGVAHL